MDKIKNLRIIISLVSVLFLALLYNQAQAQQATATWVLTSNANVTVTGNITATPHVFGPGVTPAGTAFNATNGATASQFNGTICTPLTDDYYEYTITTNCFNDLTIDSISLSRRTSSTTVARCLQLKYTVDNGVEDQIGLPIVVNSTTTTPYSTGTISILVPQGKTLRLRIYGAANSTSVSMAVKNLVIYGNTVSVAGTLPAISISASPSGPICPGNTVIFTATQSNGGSAPSYQWKLNSNNVGANSITYITNTLADGDIVTCDLTSNIVCAQPQTVSSNSILTNYLPTSIQTPGPISGPLSPDVYTPSLAYGIAAIPNATAYNWSVPPGWVITGGAGTTGITVTSGGAGQAGNISVSAANACVSSSPSSLAVSTLPPHDNCSQCHITHTAAGGVITGVLGNANLCMSCHNTNGSASLHPFSNAMKAIPGVSGNSHAWDKAAVNPFWESNTPSNADMALRLPNGEIICSTCHNQHNPIENPKYLRVSNTGDAICKDCHSSRNVGTYASNPLNKGSHPVGVIYNAADARFLPEPTNPFSLLDSKVECSSCHQAHYASTNDGYLLKATNDNTLCASCHVDKTKTMTMDHEGMGCKTCHATHNTDKGNILMVSSNIITPNSGTKSTVFTANTNAINYATGSGSFNGVCEVCHTNTDHYTNTSAGTSDSRHAPSPQKCVSCHPHNNGFYPVTDCFDCHKNITDKPGIGPAGGRRQIVDNSGNGLGSGGDFKRYTHHVQGGIPTIGDCLKCHYMGDHMNGSIKLLDPDQGFLNVITYDPLNKSSVEGFCMNCHDANGSNGSMTPFSDNATVPAIDANMWNNSSHNGAISCLDCHDNGHGSNKSNILGPFDYAGIGTGTDLMNEEEAFCLNCHGSGGSATVKVHLAFSTYSNTTTDFYKHDPGATYRLHDKGENTGTAFGGANRHIECVDCHNPHGVKSGTATAPALLPTLTGVSGVEPSYAGVGAPTGFSWLNTVTAEYQVCYKCHSSFTTLPTYLPGGFDGDAVVADGLKKLTTGGTNNQIADSRDMAEVYNPANASYHPVMAVGKNAGINPSTFRTGWNSNSRLYCTSCHSNPKSGTSGMGRGPHGSQNLHILDQATPGGAAANYKTTHSSTLASSADVCGKCHQDGTYWTNDNNSRFTEHKKHIEGEQAECYLCHNSHGGTQFHLMNFNRNVPNCLTAVTPNSQNAFNHAPAGTNSCVITCHGAGHSTSLRTYTPAYQ